MHNMLLKDKFFFFCVKSSTWDHCDLGSPELYYGEPVGTVNASVNTVWREKLHNPNIKPMFI